jgi:HlyD family secretion protein
MNTVAPVAPGSGLALPDSLTRRPTRRRIVIAVGLLAAVVAAGAIAFQVLRPGAANYRTAPVTLRTVVQAVEAQGRLDVWTRFDVPSPVTGRLVNIAIEAGAAVVSGQVLAQLDTDIAQVSVEGARAARRAAASRVSEARAALNVAQDTRRRTEALAERGLSSESDVVGAKATEGKAEAALQGATAELASANEKVTSENLAKQDRTIRAPGNGVVIDAPRWPGAVVGPATGPLFVIGSDLDTLRLDASVPEADIGSVRAGQTAEYSVPAFPGRTFRAEVVARAIQPDASSTGTTYRVTLRATNPERVLLPGMTATVKLEVARADNAVTVREAALRFTPDPANEAPSRSRVWRLDAEHGIVPVAVTAGVSDAAYTAVSPKDPQALRAGDSVIIGLPPTSASDSDKSGPGITLRKR